jgi:hypothetical protein
MHDEVIQRTPFLPRISVPVDCRSAKNHPRLRDVILCRKRPHGFREITSAACGEKSETTEVHAENRNSGAVYKARAAKKCSISAKRDQRIDRHWILEALPRLCDFVQLVLEFELEPELGRETREPAQYFGKIVVPGVTNDAYAHQPARSCAPRTPG